MREKARLFQLHSRFRSSLFKVSIYLKKLSKDAGFHVIMKHDFARKRASWSGGILKIYPASKVTPDIGVIRMIRTNHVHVNTH